MSNKQIRIAIIGSHGIPAEYGGFETFAEELSVGLCKYEHIKVSVVCSRKSNINSPSKKHYAVDLIYSRFAKARNPILYYFDSYLRVMTRADIIYSLGPAGGLFAWIPRLFGKAVLINPDGLNSQRAKWKPMIKIAFKIFEYATVRTASLVICDSIAIQKYIELQYNTKKGITIPYGAYENPFSSLPTSNLHSQLFTLGSKLKVDLENKNYYLVVARMVPENNILVIMESFAKLNSDKKLIIVGNLDKSEYCRELQSRASSNTFFVGGIYDKEELSLLRFGCYAYIHGHSVGGTNPSLLEAMAAKNGCICHDNEFNRETTENNALYFQTSEDLFKKLNMLDANPNKIYDMQDKLYKVFLQKYTWPNIVEQYANLLSEKHYCTRD